MLGAPGLAGRPGDLLYIKHHFDYPHLGLVGGGSVHLGPVKAGESLLITEGIENGFVVQGLTERPCWACLSNGGIEKVVLPDFATNIIIAGDHDRPGLASAHRAASRFRREGRVVRIVVPPELGADFNDWMIGGTDGS